MFILFSWISRCRCFLFFRCHVVLRSGFHQFFYLHPIPYDTILSGLACPRPVKVAADFLESLDISVPNADVLQHYMDIVTSRFARAKTLIIQAKSIRPQKPPGNPEINIRESFI